MHSGESDGTAAMSAGSKFIAWLHTWKHPSANAAMLDHEADLVLCTDDRKFQAILHPPKRVACTKQFNEMITIDPNRNAKER